MFEEFLAEQNPHWQGKSKDTGVPREALRRIIPQLDKKQILVLTGIRRCGKSTLLHQIKEHLLSKGIPPRNILFLNVEHPTLDTLREDVKVMEDLVKEYESLMEPEGRIFVLLDEVQFLKNWQVFIKARYEPGKTKFIITGSNSWLLSSEYASLLSGRTLSVSLFPFSFGEFLTARGIDANTKLKVAAQQKAITKAVKEYTEWGGFPEVVLEQSPEQKKEILHNYYKNILYRDVIPRFGITNIRYMEELAQYLLSNVGKLSSYNNLSKLVGLSDKTVKDYREF